MNKAIRFLTHTAAIFGAVAAISGMTAGAEWVADRALGDVNNDQAITVADLAAVSQHILGGQALDADTAIAEYDEETHIVIDFDGSIRSGGQNTEPFAPLESQSVRIDTGDLDQNGRIDVFDFVTLRKMVVNEDYRVNIYRWNEPVIEPPAEVSFIDPPIYDLYGSMPSQGTAEIAVFYVDFPDCRYDYMPTETEISNAVFGEEAPDSSSYPFESMNAFFGRASKGALRLDGQAFTYTTKFNKSYYENDVWHITLVDEIIAAFDGQVDFSQFDSDGDRTIDTILISVPTAAGDDNWWPAAGIFGGECSNRADGMDIGHVIVGNSQLAGGSSEDFVSSYVHESGHCMGLPDYYLYTEYDDFQGMHGSAGFALMDDANCDLCAASKLMLGWYTEDQVQIYDPGKGSQTFRLTDSQTDSGNCIIIPRGSLGDKYRSEFFILEYTTLGGNNSGLGKEWWRATGSGVRVLHVEATVTGDFWFNSWKYASGEDEATNYNKGRRFIRLVSEADDYTDNLSQSGSVINSSTDGFRWYDDNGGLTIDPGLTVYIGDITDGSFTVTITNN